MDSNREHENDSIDVESLITWSLTQPSLAAELANLTTDADGGLNESSPFRYRSDLNAKICLWIGDLTSLNAHAIINSTNESLTDKNPNSDAIFSKAGSRLKEEIFNNVQGCRTGNAVITKGYNLPARYIIHTVGPKYHVMYKTAAESSLYHCYRHVMELVREHRLSTVAIPTIHSVRRSYPPDEGAHIALRTVRRFLEQYGDTIQRLVFVVDSAEWSIYELLTPLYFPRSLLEERYALKHLPQDIGNQTGEPVIHDRRIRIIDNPQHSYLEESVDLASQLNSSVAVGSHAFAHMEDDVDKMRLLGGAERERPTTAIETLTQEAQRHERYERLLRRAKTEDLTEVSGIGCLYQSGVDKLGRPVIVFVGKWFKFSEINLDKALLYLIYLLDPIVKGDYVVVYFHTLTSSENHPSMSWIREVYNVLEYKHRKHLKSFYIVHPTIWTKIMTWWFTTFMAPAIKEKVHSVPGIEYLYSVIDMDQLEIPVFLTEYDMTVNGVRYYRPESDI